MKIVLMCGEGGGEIANDANLPGIMSFRNQKSMASMLFSEIMSLLKALIMSQSQQTAIKILQPAPKSQIGDQGASLTSQHQKVVRIRLILPSHLTCFKKLPKLVIGKNREEKSIKLSILFKISIPPCEFRTILIDQKELEFRGGGNSYLDYQISFKVPVRQILCWKTACYNGLYHVFFDVR